MKNTLTLLAAGLAMNLVTVTAQAALIDRGNGMIYDDDLNVTWLADANSFKTQYDADDNILATLIGQAVADGSSSHTTTASDFNTITGEMTWWGAQAWAASLSYGGHDDWRLPTVTTNCTGFNCTSGSELGHLFYNELGGSAGATILASHDTDYALFSNIQGYYWTSSDNAGSLYTWDFNTRTGAQESEGYKAGKEYAWVVRSGDVYTPPSNNTVPEPDSIWLLALGFLALARASKWKSHLFLTA